MSTKNANSGQKNISAFILIAMGVILAVAAVFYLSSDEAKAVEGGQGEAAMEAEAVAADDSNAQSVEIDVKAALAPRTIGNEDAPIKVTEFASLSCGHCAKFHATTLKELQSKYIDTGKLRIVFSDFPLNKPALEGSMVARCLPAESYLPFTSMLFEKQNEWAFSADYQEKLEQYAADYGMGKPTFEACLRNDALRHGIVNRIEAAQRRWKISSTPSFVINNKTTITGALPLVAFEAAFEKFAE